MEGVGACPKGGEASRWRCPALAIFVFAGTTAAGAADGSPDYGAPCCADLDQRIAELEAMVARKGNRTVSLQISGLVNNGVMAWDDGGESNAYVVTNDNQRSRFSFVGKAAIDAQWEAGYAIDVGHQDGQLQAGQSDSRPWLIRSRCDDRVRSAQLRLVPAQ